MEPCVVVGTILVSSILNFQEIHNPTIRVHKNTSHGIELRLSSSAARSSSKLKLLFCHYHATTWNRQHFLTTYRHTYIQLHTQSHTLQENFYCDYIYITPCTPYMFGVKKMMFSLLLERQVFSIPFCFHSSYLDCGFSVVTARYENC